MPLDGRDGQPNTLIISGWMITRFDISTAVRQFVNYLTEEVSQVEESVEEWDEGFPPKAAVRLEVCQVPTVGELGCQRQVGNHPHERIPCDGARLIPKADARHAQAQVDDGLAKVVRTGDELEETTPWDGVDGLGERGIPLVFRVRTRILHPAQTGEQIMRVPLDQTSRRKYHHAKVGPPPVAAIFNIVALRGCNDVRHGYHHVI